MSASSALIDRWRAHLALDRRRSVHTVRAYQATAERLVAFLEQHRGEAVTQDMLASLEQADLRAFLTSRRLDGIGNLSAARELSAVRGFLRFVGGEDARPPRLKGPRVKRGLPRPVSPDEALALAADIAETAREGWIGARDWAVLLLLYGAGLRIGEAMGLTGAVWPLGDTLRVTGKRGKTRLVPLLPQLRAAIESYVAACPYPLARAAASACQSAPRPTPCATASPRICWVAARICAVCRNCSAMPACRQRKFTPRSMPPTCSTSTATPILAPDPVRQVARRQR